MRRKNDTAPQIQRSSAAKRIHRPRWTRAQVETLRKLYRTHSNSEIAEAVDRSVSSVVFKAHCLGLEKGIRRLREMGRENIEKRWRPRRGGRPPARPRSA